MLLEDKTFENFGYKISNLYEKSTKKIYAQCDFCKTNYITTLNIIEQSNKICGKHSCGSKDCKKQKTIESNIIKYGYSNSFSNPEIQKKQRETIKKRYGVDNVSQIESIQEKKRKKYREKNNGKMISEWAKIKNKQISTMGQQIKKYGLNSALKIQPQETGIEIKIEECISKFCNFEKQFKIENRRADFKIDNIIIECDGLYWHSDSITKDQKRDYNKRIFYIEKGFKPLFFYENEINNKIDIISSIIKNKLKINTDRIYARKCVIKDVNKKETKDFLNKNHLMGYGKGDSIGLYYNNDLVSIAQIINKKNNYEISRFCNKLNTSVIGGFSKIISKFNNKDLSTFIDLRYGSGEYLKNLGFSFVREQISFKWTDFNDTFHRMKYPGNTGYDYKMYKIWDCGQAKWVKYA